MLPAPLPMTASSDRPVTVRTLRELGEIDSIRELWTRLQTHPWSDVDYYLEHHARQEEFLRPHVLVLERDGHPIGLVAGSIQRTRLPWRIGSLTVARSRARVLWIGAGGVMGEASESTAQALTTEFLAVLGRGEADAAYLHQIDTASTLRSRLSSVPGMARDRWARPSVGWVLELPESYEAYLASRTKSVRRHLKRYANALERELGTDFQIVCHREPSDLEVLIRDSEAVARLTYHRGMGVGFRDTPSLRRVFTHALRAGWLRAYVMHAKGRPIAFWHGMAYAGTFFTRDTGYDPAFGELRPGNYLLSRVIEEHCRTRETRCFDYGVMDLEYKRNFGTRRYERSSVYLFSRHPRGLVLSGMRSVSGAADQTARLLLGSRARHWARKLAKLGRRPPVAPEEGEGEEHAAQTTKRAGVPKD